MTPKTKEMNLLNLSVIKAQIDGVVIPVHTHDLCDCDEWYLKDMTEIFPNYYYKFSCIADKCKHSCCIGWEIDIDEDTAELYGSLDGELGEKIRKNICGEPPHFILREGDRCPFLKENGLCEIICEYGDGAISDICALHPRFSNFYTDFIETGLGLCCEEAARIILSETEKFRIDLPTDAPEKEFFAIRQRIFDVLQDREKSVGERLKYLAKEIGLALDGLNLYELYMPLERLDEAWTEELLRLKDYRFEWSVFDDGALQIPFEQLAVYFIFRHLKEGRYREGIGFMLISCALIAVLFSKNNNLQEIVRMYSSEIEYSEENTEMLMRKREVGL